MAASYSLQEFVGGGVLKDILDKLEEDGWDDVPTFKMMRVADMESLHLTEAQRDAIELRTYLHDRNLMDYADKLEASGRPLPELLNTPPSQLASQYHMKRGHVARFVNRSIGCGVQLPANLDLPVRNRRTVQEKQQQQQQYQQQQQPYQQQQHYQHQQQQQRTDRDGGLPLSPRVLNLLASNGNNGSSDRSSRTHERQPSFDLDRGNWQSGHERDMTSPRNAAGENGGTGMRAPIRGRMAVVDAEPRMCGLIRPAQVADSVSPLSVLEKIYVQKLAPEHKTGTSGTIGVQQLPPAVKAFELWKSKPTLLLCLRRPGCVMCRAEAHQMYHRKAIFDAMGIQLVAVLSESIDNEVKAFWPRYWGGMVVLDRNKDFFKALGGGKLMRENLVTGFIFNGQARRNWTRAKSTGFDYNFHGEGRIKGGLYILGPGSSGVAYQFVERTFGDWAPLEEVLDVCTKLQASLPKAMYSSNEFYTGASRRAHED